MTANFLPKKLQDELFIDMRVLLKDTQITLRNAPVDS